MYIPDFISSLVAWGLASEAGRDVNFRLPLVNGVVAPNGIARQAVLPGGTFPGPLIKGWKGDTFNVDVEDMLTNETMLTTTSVHFHGIDQHHTNFADGVAFVTQCPLVHGESFTHTFQPKDQAGTFWYHSHLKTQYCDGLRGPLVIYDPHDPHKDLYDVDDEGTIISLADWYNEAFFYQPPIAEISNVLINGFDGYNTTPAVIHVQHGKRYRFRLIAMSCEPSFTFSIDGHENMTVIEADGENTEPLNVDTISISAAQRYSFVLHANQPVGNYWIRSVGAVGFHGQGRNLLNHQSRAILRYQGAANENPTTHQSHSTNPLLEQNLHALENPKAPGEPVINGTTFPPLNLDLNFTGEFFTINGVAFNTSLIPIPVLLQMLSGRYRPDELLPKGSVYPLPRNRSVQVSLPITQSAAGGPHPFHLHGHSFSVIRSAGTNEIDYAHPVRRDTVSTGNPGDNVTIRFETDNPGPWIFHCHIDQHLALGFAIVFAEEPGEVREEIHPPHDWYELCPKYNMTPPNVGLNPHHPHYLLDQN